MVGWGLETEFPSTLRLRKSDRLSTGLFANTRLDRDISVQNSLTLALLHPPT